MNHTMTIHEALRICADAVSAKMSALAPGEPEDQLRRPFEIFMAYAAHALGWFVALVSIVLFFVQSSWAASSDAFRTHFNLPEDPEPLLQRILSADEFREQPIQAFMERLLEWLGELLSRALDWLLDSLPSVGPIHASGGSLWYVLTALLLVGLLALILIVAVRVVRFAQALPPRSSPTIETGDEGSGTPAAKDAWDVALRMATQARYSEAVTHLFRFVVFWLDEHGQLAFHPSKTNRELLAGVAGHAAFREALSKMIPVFDSIRYGGLQCGQTEYERFLSLCRSVTGRA